MILVLAAGVKSLCVSVCACVSVHVSVRGTCAQLGCWLTLRKWQLSRSARSLGSRLGSKF